MCAAQSSNNLSSGRLAGKVAIVTGAGSRSAGVGTGKAISVLFARQGASVCLVDIHPDHAQETLRTIEGEGGEAVALVGDVTVDSDCRRIVEEAAHHYGKLDVLVNNVGIVPAPGKVHELSEEGWDEIMRVNLKSVVLMSKHAIPKLVAGGGGSIVNISSIGAIASTGSTPAYGASKAAMNRLTADMAVAYGRDHVRVNAIMPGQIYTPLVAGGMSEETRDLRRRMSPLGIEGTAWDIAWTAVFLASDEARYVSAAIIPVDGGLTQTSASQTHRFASD